MASDDLLVRKFAVSIIGIFMGLVLGAIALKNLKDGEFGTKGGNVSRIENPVTFWFTTLFCGLWSVVSLVATANYVFFTGGN